MLRKDLDVEGIYNNVELIPKDVRFLAGLTDLLWKKSVEYLEPIEENTCLSNHPPPPGYKRKTTRYDTAAFEYLMWMNALLSMAWLLTNVKKKTEHGQCHNPIHNEIQEQTGLLAAKQDLHITLDFMTT
ncbi:MAG TPA: hypothetical protein VE130_09535 [Nitrososphaeraceae archaeon]|nr:hypothetical protein [Nitrososphaeraceae archaeon]